MRTLLVVLALIVFAHPAEARTPKRECLAACQAKIVECSGTCGDYGVAEAQCRKAVLRSCRLQGAGICSPPTTTSTTSTTIPPVDQRSVTVTISDRALSAFRGAARVTLSIGPEPLMRYRLLAQSPGYHFCWSLGDGVIIQGARQFGLLELEQPGDAAFRIARDDDGSLCTELRSGIEVVGTIDRFPVGFDPNAPFAIDLDHVFCEPEYLGVCRIDVP